MDRNGQQQYSSYNVYTLCATGNLGSKVYQKNILNTITPTSSSLNCWYLAGWIHAFTFFTPNCYPTIAMLQQQSMLGRPVSIFLVSVPVSYFDQPVWIAGSISFFLFYSTQCSLVSILFKVSCIMFRDVLPQILVVRVVIWVIAVFLSAQSSLAIFLLSLVSTRHFPSSKLALRGYFLFFKQFSANPKDDYAKLQ